MVSKVVILCAFAVMVQSIAGQSCYRSSSSSSSSGCGCQSISIPSSGGALVISAVGPISPSGIAVATDLGLAGNLDVSGTLPYLSAVAFEGQFDTRGTAPVSYGCGDCVAITQPIGGFTSPQNIASQLNLGSSCGCGR